jgi:hypothetical protein
MSRPLVARVSVAHLQVKLQSQSVINVIALDPRQHWQATQGGKPLVDCAYADGSECVRTRDCLKLLFIFFRAYIDHVVTVLVTNRN